MTPDKIFEAIEEETGVSKREILGECKWMHISQARIAAMYLCRTLCRMSYPTIGIIFDGRDHSTIMHALNRKRRNNDWRTQIVPAVLAKLGIDDKAA